jgi:hypothetical protein
VWKSTGELGYSGSMAQQLHAIEQMQFGGQRRVDGVGT